MLTGLCIPPDWAEQSSVKSQIAYASTAQIGLIFIEIAAGFENFALFHFAGNAFKNLSAPGLTFSSELPYPRAVL